MFDNASLLSKLIQKKEISPFEVCNEYLNRVKAFNIGYNVFVTINDNEGLTKYIDGLKNGTTSPLYGLPVASADNIVTSDMPTTCSSKMLENFKAPYDATVISRLKENNAFLLGKTNMPEFGMGVDKDAISGLSAAVREKAALFGISSDADGSLRISSAVCGVVGYKPSFGAVSRHGLISYASSIDQIGTISRSVEDTMLLAKEITGYDEKDSRTVEGFKLDCNNIEKNSLKGKKIGVLDNLFAGTEKGESAAFDAMRLKLKTAGAGLVPIKDDIFKSAVAAHRILCDAEASSNLAKFDGVRFGYRSSNYFDTESLYVNSRTEGFGDNVKKHIIAGTYFLSAKNFDKYYKAAVSSKMLLLQNLSELLKGVDAVLMPVIGAKDYTSYTGWVNLAGLPAITLPVLNEQCASVQLIGKRFSDEELLGIARAYEKEFGLGGN